MLADYSVVSNIPVADMNRARRFYSDVLNLKPGMERPGMLFMECGNGTAIALYETSSAGQAQHTLASWKVTDLKNEMSDMRQKGVQFEDYDTPGLTTQNGVATMGDERAAWFKDSEGNTLCVAQMS